MTGSTSRRLLVAAVLALAPLAALSPAGATPPPLSPFCASLHASEGNTISGASGSISIAGSFAVGEQVRFTPTGTDPVIHVVYPGGAQGTTNGVSGQPTRYPIETAGTYQFSLTTTGPISLTLACGIPPQAVITTPSGNPTYTAHQVVTPAFSCVAGTNAATCTPEHPGPVDTSTVGDHYYVVTATDSADLLTTAAVPYTVAKAQQTLHFTSDPPTDAIVGYRYLYAVTAESSSGLPVVYSGDPSSDVCFVANEEPFIYGNVSPNHAGTCTVYVDQPGNDVYAPAPRITMTFQIGREATFVYPQKASKGVLGLSVTTFKAGLTQRGWFGPGYGAEFPYPGQTVVFRVGGKVMCTGTTVYVNDGSFFGSAIATCTAKIGLNLALKYNSYTATYGGSRDYLPSTATRKFGS